MNSKSFDNSPILSYYFTTFQFLKSNKDLNKLYNCFSNSKNFIRKISKQNFVQSLENIQKTNSDEEIFFTNINDFEEKTNEQENNCQNDIFFESNETNKFVQDKFLFYEYENEKNNNNQNKEIINDVNVNKVYFNYNNNVNSNIYFYSNKDIIKDSKNEILGNTNKINQDMILINNSDNILSKNLYSNNDKKKTETINTFISNININSPSFTPLRSIKNNDSLALKFLRQEKKYHKDNESSTERTSSSTSNNEEKNENQFSDKNEENKDYLVEMFGRKGWICKLCHNFNYETRNKCNRCKVLKVPEIILGYKTKKNHHMNNFNEQNIFSNNDNARENYHSTRDPKFFNNKKNDWICTNCYNLNYAFRKVCNRCKAPKVYYLMDNIITKNTNINKNINMFTINNESLFCRPLFESNE